MASIPLSLPKRQPRHGGEIHLYYPSHVNVRTLGRFTRFEEEARSYEYDNMGCEHDFCMQMNVSNVCLRV